MNVSRRHLLILLTLSLLVLGIGCSDRDPSGMEQARATIDPLVFTDAYHGNVYFQAFAETHYGAVETDSVYAYGGYAPDGGRSLKVTIPARDSALGIYAGGVLTSAAPRDIADFNALTFYTRADIPRTLDLAGLGNDNTGTSLYEAGRADIDVDYEWSFVVVPIPSPSKLIAERGLFTFAEGFEDSFATSGAIWFDEIKYANLSNFEVTRSSMNTFSALIPYFVGSKVVLGNGTTTYLMDGAHFNISHSPNYFDLESKESSIVAITPGVIEIVGVGLASITATLDDFEVSGRVNVEGFLPPTTAAPTPTLPAANVISLWSAPYNGINVDTWNADWGMPVQVSNYTVAGRETKMYTNLQWAGIIIKSPMINTTAMTHLHLDVYAPSGTDFKVKLVSFPTDGPKAERELAFDSTTTPAFNEGTWSMLEIPLADFQFPDTWDAAHIGELIISTGDAKLVLVDNVYFHN